MKTIIYIFLLIFLINSSYCQNLDWVRTVKYISLNPAEININDVCIDNFDRQYSISNGNNQANFSFNGNQLTATGSDNYGAIIKSNPAGNHEWIKFFSPLTNNGSCIPNRIVYHNGYIYVSGINNGSIDMDPSSVVNFLNGNSSPFVVKLDTAGNFIWAKSFGSINTKVNDLVVDNFDNVFITGAFNTDFTFNGISQTSNGDDDIYFLKFNNQGLEQWCRTFGSNSFLNESGKSISIDSNGNVIIAGYFAETVDFDAGPASFTLSSVGAQDGFITKYSQNGSHINTVKIGGLNSDRINFIDINNSFIYVTGHINGNVDLDPGPSVSNVTAPLGSTPGFILKLDSQFNLIWSKIISTSSGSMGFEIQTKLNEIYLSGVMTGITDLNPDPVQGYSYSSNGAFGNTYIIKLDSNGNFIWGAGFMNTDNSFMIGNYGYENYPNGIAISNNAVYVGGGYKGAVDFNPNQNITQVTQSATTPTGIGVMSGFLVKLSNCPSSSSSSTISQCQSYTWPSNNTTYTTSGTYTDTLVNVFGCDSIITLNLTILPAQTNSVSITQCDSYTSPLGNTYSSSGSFTETYTSVNGCDSLVTLNLTITDIQNTVNISACGNYLSPLGNNYNASGTYQETYTTSNGCDSTLTIQLTVNNSITLNETKTACSNYLSPSGNTYTQSGQYYDTLLTSSGCDSIIITQLTILSSTQSIISPVVCSSYTSPSGITYNQTGTYIDTIQNVNGCDSIITINLSVVGTLNVNAGPDITICSGESITLNGAGATNYSWSNGVSNNIPFSPTVTTNYEVIGTDGNGCSGKDSILVYVNNPPTVAFNSILPDCEGGLSGSINVSVTGSSPFSYQWSNGSSAQNLTNVSTGNYNLSVTDANGCEIQESFNLQDGEGDCLIVPTGFSPNGDNENDNWNIIGIEQFTKNQVQVFNRWGQTVFESNGTAVNWDGSYNDKLLPIADYYFVVDLGNGQVTNGTLTIKY